MDLAFERALAHARHHDADPTVRQRLALQKAADGWGRVGDMLYFNRGALRVRLDADRCPGCRVQHCPHMQAVRFVTGAPAN